MERIRVLVADDEETVLDVLSALITSDASLDLVGTAKDAESAIDLACQEHPDVALLDARMPGGGGVRAAREIRRRCPSTRLVAISAYEDRDTVLTMLRAGALSYVAKGDSTQQVLKAIHRSTEGKASISASLVADVAEALAEYQAYRARVPPKQRDRMERIQRVLDGDELTMVYQPIVDLREGRVVGAEALARFAARPRRPPNAWFADAVSVGRLVELEVMAARVALAELDRLPSEAYLSVNLSPETVCSPSLYEALNKGVDIGRVVLEMTENAPVDDYEALGEALRHLRGGGIRLAIDDVGAGFSSLRHVVRLHPDFMKLDLTLTAGIDSDRTRQALVSTLVSFASQIGITLVAEGVETHGQLETLRALGVPYGQGFYLGRPGPVPMRARA